MRAVDQGRQRCGVGASVLYVPILDKPRKKRSAKRLENDELIRPRTLCVKCGAKTASLDQRKKGKI